MDFSLIVTFLHTLNPLVVMGMIYILSLASLYFFWRAYGKVGLFLYSCLAVIVSNLQVLKGTYFPFQEEPVALGSVLFMSLFLCTDMLNELYGKKAALTSVNLGFMAYLFITVFMILTIGYPPLAGDTLLTSSHDHLHALFMPAPAILIASFTAYYVSQFADIWVFRKIHALTAQKHLWLRTFVSTLIGLILDNTIFSLLAWHVLSPTPYPLSHIFWTYMVGTGILRIILILGYIPMMYWVHRKRDQHQ